MSASALLGWCAMFYVAVSPAGRDSMSVRLYVSSRSVGDRRNWLNPWKPSIDALGQMLGHSRRPKSGTAYPPRQSRD